MCRPSRPESCLGSAPARVVAAWVRRTVRECQDSARAVAFPVLRAANCPAQSLLLTAPALTTPFRMLDMIANLFV